MSEMRERIWAGMGVKQFDARTVTRNPWWTDTPRPLMTEYVRADIVAAKDARIEFLEKALGQAKHFAAIDLTWSVDDVDQRAWWTLECDANDVEIPNSAFDELAAWLREQE